MLDLTDRDFPADAERVEALGAQRVSDNEEEGVRWVALRDPEGNKFRVGVVRPTLVIGTRRGGAARRR